MLIYFAGNSFDKNHEEHYIYISGIKRRLQSYHYMKRLLEFFVIMDRQ